MLILSCFPMPCVNIAFYRQAPGARVRDRKKDRPDGKERDGRREKRKRGEESKGKLHLSGMSAAVNSPTPHYETSCVRAQVGPILCY